MGDRPPGEITHREIDRFVNVQISSGFKLATVNRRLAAILALKPPPLAPVMQVLKA